MKILLFVFPLVFFYGAVKAQSGGNRIMDTSVSWDNSGSGVNGQVYVYVNDSSNITGLTVAFGSTDTTSNYFSGTYTIPSGSVTLQQNSLSLPIGYFSNSVRGYLRITLQLSDGTTNKIDVMK